MKKMKQLHEFLCTSLTISGKNIIPLETSLLWMIIPLASAKIVQAVAEKTLVPVRGTFLCLDFPIKKSFYVIQGKGGEMVRDAARDVHTCLILVAVTWYCSSSPEARRESAFHLTPQRVSSILHPSGIALYLLPDLDISWGTGRQRLMISRDSQHC